MIWADNKWIFSDDKEKLTWMVNHIIEELLDLDVKPKLESSTNKDEDETTLKEGCTGKSPVLLFVEVFGLPGCRFRSTGKGIQGFSQMVRKGMGSWWPDGCICRAKLVSLRRKCDRVASHVFSTALNGSVNRPCSMKE